VCVGPFTLRVSGGCGRCVMVNVQPQTGERSSALYALLNACRKQEGRVMFGSLLTDVRHHEAETIPQNDEKRTTPRWWPIHTGMPCHAN
jgi:uncharacterized protein YcbX